MPLIKIQGFGCPVSYLDLAEWLTEPFLDFDSGKHFTYLISFDIPISEVSYYSES